MPTVENILKSMRANKRDVRFSDCLKVCKHYFGEPRIRGSHHSFMTPWLGEPWVYIQSDKGKAEVYQVEQVIDAIEKLERERNV